MTPIREQSGPTIADLVNIVRQRFSGHGVANASDTARRLVGGLLNRDLTALVLNADELVAETDRSAIVEAAGRVCDGEPLYRVLGGRAFYGLDLIVSPDVLDPRPDTEILVDASVPLALRAVKRSGRCNILDLGTGSGAIGLALAHTVGQATIIASDRSPAALAVARENARSLGLEHRFQTVQSDWFAAITGRFELIVSNPPYIRTSVIETLDRQVRDFDPRGALDGGPDGLDAYRAIAGGCRDVLADHGLVALEIGFDQKEAVRLVFEECGFELRTSVRDLGGRDRVLVFAESAGGDSEAGGSIVDP